MTPSPIFLALALLVVPGSVSGSTDLTTFANVVTTSAAPEATTLSVWGTCIEASLPDVMGLSQCIGSSLDLCTDNNTVTEGMKTLINCTAVLLSKNLTPMNALITMRTTIILLAYKITPAFGQLLDLFMAPLRSFEAATIKDNVCRGEVKVRFPNSLGKCLGDTVKVCGNGTVVDMSFAESLASFNLCMMIDWLSSTPLDNIKTFVCDIMRGSKALFAADIAVGPAVYGALLNATCP